MSSQSARRPGPVVLVHGGAGEVPEAKRAEHAEGCRRAAEAGLAAIRSGGSALDGATAAVRVLEDDAHFNAGTGACLNTEGNLELDASVMEGTTLRAGAVCAMPPFKNPILVARAALDEGRHVLYAAQGAAAFARSQGFAEADPETMITSAARKRLAVVKSGAGERGWAGGTVGAVACDAQGHVAAATSTGGMVDKRAGRVGDSSIIGAGTWADDLTGAASATGDGEAAIRFGIARFVCELLARGLPAQQAADATIAAFGDRVRGSGGIIVVSPRGGVGFARNTATMSWGMAREGLPSRSGW